jgi:hypothetical protein
MHDFTVVTHEGAFQIFSFMTPGDEYIMESILPSGEYTGEYTTTP